jgi:rubrerythrin
MIAQRTFTTTSNILQEAAQVLDEHQMADTSHWVCEVCGMLHAGSPPASCESCGSSDAFAEMHDERTEIGNRW